MSIAANYEAPTSFSFTPPSYRAGSSLILTCEVEGVGYEDAGVFYEWKSSCEGNCFARGETVQTVFSQYLHSYDQGVHICVVHDQRGCSGNASITVNVVGTGYLCSSLCWCFQGSFCTYLRFV